ncbi:MAG: glycosyltransferase family 1 protein [Candidatus Daviesbacteria bacterium]|nr:glycosyltransferase family 1 protein [Candidatus Daviesbacteria bacterium]
MIIGYDASRAFIGKKTGTENYSYQILSHLQKIDHNNKYYVYVRAGSSRPLQSGSDNPTPTIIPYPRLWTQFGLALQTFIDPLDILFIPAHTLPIIRKPGLKTVITVHDLGAEFLPESHQLKQRLYLNFMTYHQLKSASHIIAVSEATKQDIIKKVGIDPRKITVVYEGYDKEKFESGRCRTKFEINQTIKKYNLMYQNYFLFVGTIQPRKNLERLIEAFSVIAILSDPAIAGESKEKQSQEDKIATSGRKIDPPRNDDLKLVLAGGKGWLSDEIYALPKKLGIEDKVKFLGYVPDEDLPALYSGAQAFLFPSLFEGFGLPILEAFACNCPVLTSNISSLPEVAGPADAGATIIVDPYSVEDIAQGIRRIMNKELRIKLVQAGREQLKKFSWEKAAKETLAVLENT